MKVNFARPSLPATGIAVVCVTSGGKLTASAEKFDKKTGGALKRAIRSSGFKGEIGQTLNIMAPSGVRLDRISRLVVAAGAAFGGYVLGNDYLNVAIVEVLGIDRSQGVVVDEAVRPSTLWSWLG